MRRSGLAFKHRILAIASVLTIGAMARRSKEMPMLVATMLANALDQTLASASIRA
jgi:hypothetical protein